MPNNTNPYTPPDTPTGKPPTKGIWRYDNWLAVSHSAELPTQWCFKTNEPTSHVGWLFLGPNFISQRKWLVSFGLNERLAKRRVWRQRISIGALLVAATIFAVVALPALLVFPAKGYEFQSQAEREYFIWLAVSMLILLFTALASLLTLLGCLTVNMIQIMEGSPSKHFTFLRGAHPDFLARFPIWERR